MPLAKLTAPTKFMVGVLALLVICGTALLNGGTVGGPEIAYGHNRWSVRAEVPPFTIAAYPKDFKRNADPRWRQPVAGEDFYDLDPPAAHASHAVLLVTAPSFKPSSFPRNDFCTFPHSHRPQAARAPPLA